MASVTGMTAEAMQAIADASVVSGSVNDGGDLILETHGGDTIDAGYIKGDPGENATAQLTVTDTSTVNLTLSGDGTDLVPWNLEADVIEPTRSGLFQLAPGYVGPGPAKVTAVGSGLGTQSGPYEWQGYFDPTGNPVVRVEDRNGTPVITGHAQGNSVGGWRALPLNLPNNLITYNSNGGGFWEPLSGHNAFGVKTSAGIVNLRGLLLATGSTIASQTTLFTLPSDMRPDVDMIFECEQSDTSTCIYIRSTGEVQNGIAITAGQYISLGNICFPASGVATWTPMTSFLNGWVDYAVSTFGVASYWVDPYGVVWFHGLIKSGTVTTGTPAWTIPGSLNTVANLQQHVSCVANSGFGCFRFSVDATSLLPTTMDIVAGSATWMSLGGVTWVSGTGLSTLNWEAPQIGLNSWGNYSSGNMTAGWCKRPDGLVMLKGLLSAGTLGAVASMILPTRALPLGRIMFQNAANAARGRIDIIGLQCDNSWMQVENAQGSNTWFSWDHVKYYAGGN